MLFHFIFKSDLDSIEIIQLRGGCFAASSDRFEQVGNTKHWKNQLIMKSNFRYNDLYKI